MTGRRLRDAATALLAAPLAGWLMAFLIITAANLAATDLAWRVDNHLLLALALAALSLPTLYAGHLLSKIARRGPAGYIWYLLAALAGPAAVALLMNYLWSSHIKYDGLTLLPFVPAFAAAIGTGFTARWLLRGQR